MHVTHTTNQHIFLSTWIVQIKILRSLAARFFKLTDVLLVYKVRLTLTPAALRLWSISVAECSAGVLSPGLLMSSFFPLSKWGQSFLYECSSYHFLPTEQCCASLTYPPNPKEFLIKHLNNNCYVLACKFTTTKSQCLITSSSPNTKFKHAVHIQKTKTKFGNRSNVAARLTPHYPSQLRVIVDWPKQNQTW